MIVLRALLLAAATAAPADYAYTWPLSTPGDGGAWQVELTPEIHAVLVDPGLRDLEVFDANNRPVPAARYASLPPKPVERSVPLPVFVLPRRAGEAAWDVRLRVERGPDSALRQLAEAMVQPVDGPRVADYLLDASQVPAPVTGLALSWTARPGETTTRMAVEGSHDLEHWTTLVPAAAVVALRQEGGTLDRREIPVPATSLPYLRLRTLDGGELGALVIDARLTPAPPTPERRWLPAAPAGTAVEEAPGGHRMGVYTYELPGWFDIEAVRLEPVGERILSQLTIRSRDGMSGRKAAPTPDRFARSALSPGPGPGLSGPGPGDTSEKTVWHARGGFTLVGVRQGDETVVRDEAAVNEGPRSRTWRVEAIPPLEAAPRLSVAPRPDRVAFLAEGKGPYRIAAGSAAARRVDAPVDHALAELRGRLGGDWEPPVATLGSREVAGGERVLAPAPVPLPWKTWLLWGVLAGGAGLVVLFGIRLLEARP